jgi:superfamily II DNA or RNA helicase
MLTEIELDDGWDTSRPITIMVENVSSTVIAPPKVIEMLSEAFSYEANDSHFIRKAKVSQYMKDKRYEDAEWWAEWNGCFSIFRENLFGTGMLEDVIMFLVHKGFEIKIIDQMDKPRLVDIPEKTTVGGMKQLHEYQHEAIDSLVRTDFRGVIYAATAAGKTVMAMHIIGMCQTTAVVIVDKSVILDQWRAVIKESFFLEETKLKGTKSGFLFETSDGNPAILLCTSKMLTTAHTGRSENLAARNSMIKKICKEAGLMIYDEAHHAASKNAQRAVKLVKAYHRVGLSATVNMREDNADFEYLALIGTVSYFLSQSDLVGIHKAATVIIKSITPRMSTKLAAEIKDLEDYRKVYDKYIIENVDRNNLIVMTAMEEVSNGSSVLIVVDRIEHAQILSVLMKDFAIYTWGVDPERAEKIQAFKSGKVNCMVATYSLIGEGFDYPNLNVLILAQAKSETKIRQSIGQNQPS